MNIFTNTFDSEKYFIAKYFLSSKTTLYDAAWNLAIGQSVGNPNVRSEWETDKLFEDHSCLILADEKELRSKKEGFVEIAFPLINIDLDTDGVSHLLCMLMGGQLDIDIVEKCQLKKLTFPQKTISKYFKGPKFGIKGIRDFVGVPEKPLVGSIIKPKTGISPRILLEMTRQLVEGGVNFIKEDEILSSPSFCRLEDRVPVISEYLKDKNVVYCFAINSDPAYAIERVKQIYALGGRGVHINFWSGLGIYKNIRELDLPIFVHFQKSGDKILTNSKHDHHIDWAVICQLATWMGVDFIHSGMWGGYMSDEETKLKSDLEILQAGGTMPALSCGLHPGLVQALVDRFGNDILLNAGGAVHGHPMGTTAGIKALVQAANGVTDKPEYLAAIEKWGLIK